MLASIREIRGVKITPRYRADFPEDVAPMALFDYTEGWYNPHRRHSTLKYCSREKVGGGHRRSMLHYFSVFAVRRYLR
jgi:transposase InsO family protein